MKIKQIFQEKQRTLRTVRAEKGNIGENKVVGSMYPEVVNPKKIQLQFIE